MKKKEKTVTTETTETTVIKKASKPYDAFENQAEAGRMLLDLLYDDLSCENEVILGMEGAGAVVAEPVARGLKSPLHIINDGRQPAFNSEFPLIEGRCAVLVDDGSINPAVLDLTIELIRSMNPAELHFCVPVFPSPVMKEISTSFDRIYCLVLQEEPPFCAAHFYRNEREAYEKEKENRKIEETICQ